MRILAIYPYPILPPLGGGALRCSNLLRELARTHEVHAIVPQGRREWDQSRKNFGLSDSVVAYSSVDNPPPCTPFHRLPPRVGPGLHYRWLRRSWRGPAEATLLRNHHLIAKALGDFAFDFVLFEHLSTAAAAPLVKRLSPHSVRILDAHNVDHILLKEELENAPGNRGKERSLKKAAWEEHNLSRIVDLFFACSDFDRDTLTRISGTPGFTVANGVDCDYFEFDDRPDKIACRNLVFTGWLGTMANRDALAFLADEIWPALRAQLPDLTLEVVGGGIPDALRQRLEDIPGLRLVGEVDDVRPSFRKASIMLVPLRIGSGTRLKILEAMAQGNPVISTPKGAEGLSVSAGEHILFAETARDFRAATSTLLGSPSEFDRIRIRARELVVQQYDWREIGRKVNKLLDGHFDMRA